MIDFHCHLDLYTNPREIIRGCVSRGMDVLSVTTTPSAWGVTSALATKKQMIRTALGLHPQLARERKKELSLFDSLLSTTRFVGEVGLDGSSEFTEQWADQVTVFEHILSSCQSAGGKILSIHSRRASSEVLQRIEAYAGVGRYILHWYSGGYRDLEKAIELKCWFSVGPNMLSSAKGRELISRMPRERILTETDGPFTAINGKRLLPWDASLAVSKLAGLWGITVEGAESQLEDNLRLLLS